MIHPKFVFENPFVRLGRLNLFDGQVGILRLVGLPNKVTTPIFEGAFSGEVHVERVDFLDACIP